AVAWELARDTGLVPVEWSRSFPWRDDLGEVLEGRAAEVCQLLHDIFGNPFGRPKVEADWLRWHDGIVPRLARVIYEEGRWGDMGVLQDALLDAGCDNEGMLSHAREPGIVHTRGCWLIDLLLNKE